MNVKKIGIKSERRNSFGRIALIFLLLTLQISLIFALSISLGTVKFNIYMIIDLVGAGLALFVNIRDISPEYKISWIVLILIFPLFGIALYFIFGSSFAKKPMAKKYSRAEKAFQGVLVQDENVLSEIENKDLAIANQIRYINRYGQYPVYKNTDAKYYSRVKDAYHDMLIDLKNAKRYIFMEYYILSNREGMHELYDILEEKAREGLDVRIIYDDLGSGLVLSDDFKKEMKKKGIRTAGFNTIVPVLMGIMNNRDHRKITVIDGDIAYTGGYNISEEYFEMKELYGKWKDAGIRVNGDAVKSFVLMFLTMWDMINGESDDINSFLGDELSGMDLTQKCNVINKSYFLPFADHPLDNETVGRNVFLNIIKNAKKYVHITTPYLILDNDVIEELNLASKRGVEVIIITPGIPDKKIVYSTTKSYYPVLAKSGIKIYEYTPGFMHAKLIISDDNVAVVGTFNFDYRSFFLHFENGVYIYNSDVIKDIEKDFKECVSLGTYVSDNHKNPTNFNEFKISVLRLFAPLF